MLRFVDGFDSYTATDDLNQKWKLPSVRNHRSILHEYDSGGWEWNATEGVNGGGCIKAPAATAAGEYLGRQIRRFGAWQNNKHGRDLFWFKIATPPAARVPLVQWYTEDNWSDSELGRHLHLDLDIDTNGHLIQRTQGSDATPGSDLFTVAINVCDNAWHCIERFWKVDFFTTSDEFILNLDGVEQYNEVGLNIATNNFYYNMMLFRTLGVDTWVDDVIAWDDTTDTLIDDWNFSWNYGRYLENFLEQGNDDFNGPLGMKQITTLRPIADEVATFSPGTNNYDLVNEIAHDGDTTYVVDNALGSRDTYQLETMNALATGIKAVVLNYQNRLREPGNIVLQPEANKGGDFELGFRRLMTDKFIVKIDPDTTPLVPFGPYANIGDWVPYTGTEANTTLSIVDGELRVANDTGATASIGATVAITTEIGKRYRVHIQRSPILPQEATAGVLIRARTVEASSQILSTSIPVNITGELSFVAVTTTTYITIGPNTAAAGTFMQFTHVAVGEEFSGMEYTIHQWAMHQDPELLTAWTPAGIDASRFGMRISL